MALTKEHLRVVMTRTQENRVEELRKILGYPVKELDREGSRFWYLRPGESKEDAADTCPIAVGFYAELNDGSDRDIRQFLTAPEQQNNIYGHYVGRVTTEQPVMYLLLPEANLQGRVVLILPTEGGLRQRQIQTFEWSDRELPGRLSRLQQGTVRIADRLTALIPQVDWVFYPGVKTAEKLAQLMAEVARRIEQAIPSVYETETAGGYLHKLFESFRKELLPTLKLQADNEKDYSFADIYAQTVAYGLFTARVFGFLKFKRERKNLNDLEPDFYRDNAWEFLPETNPFLRKLFEDISKQPPEDLGEDLVSAVSELLSVLRAAEMDAVLSDFEQKIGQEDIIIRFYEDFLKAYKPQMRERRGVYYTPEPVVSYMVRSVDILLKEKFNKPLGLADPEVMILDPACGTGTFLLWICQLIYQRFQELPEALTEGLADKSWSGYVKERLLPRIFGFELLMAPYAIAHLKLSLFLKETGYQFNSGKRLGIYLTNTLDDAVRKTETLFEEFIAQEADQATEIKRDLPIMVVVGNPPYSANSANTKKWATDLVRDSYYPKDEIKEQNPKLLLDDYVKFIRFAQWRIEQTGYGILSFITNHGYLDNPTFRGMRQSLIQTFDTIYTLDLHGNSKRKEKTPNGSKDENVFDIQQGVAIGIFTQVQKKSQNINTTYHTNLWGSREAKHEWLNKNDIATTKWSCINPKLPFSLFSPQDVSLLPEYELCWKITDAMPLNSTGARTHRDDFVMNFDLSRLYDGISSFRNLDISDVEISENYNLKDTRDWKLSKKRLSLAKNKEWEKFFTKTLYRPFDFRQYYHHADVVEFPRNEIVGHLLVESNFALLWTRPLSPSYEFSILVSGYIPHQCVIGNKNAGAGASYIAPLYLYPNTNSSLQLALEEQSRPNFSPDFLKDITSKLGYTPTPEAIFYYIYAIFHSPTYRTRYAEFLKIDFPRVPLTSSDKLFHQLAAYGEELVSLHLMKSPKLDNTITQYEDRGGDRVVDIAPKYQQGDVIINKKGDRFTGVPENVWNFYVGGYQVCQKWLKDRKGRTLSDEDILHYMRIVVALQETIELMAKIDAAIPGFPIQ
ncbi:type ISP restriction/modification enzyme [Chroococcidiopsis sp. CCNUC1]|uniref:type ISP restriction/modification enzyme n=1 Tax=Chroococcidiopsis sp. CCNUC1 TaxID=2653189 RepID=UPI002021D8C7|nr:type ISP restriction/modification enzyme [Chroococcidiopsis sp. CCNUC1]URD48650.1 N-6 DNA methylase [Chroococcidiopsis sp. CCNUC1]